MSASDIRKVLKLRESNLSLRQIAGRLNLHYSTISRWVQRAQEQKLNSEEASKLRNAELEHLFRRHKGPKAETAYPVDAKAICEAIDEHKLERTEAYIQYLEAAKCSELPPLKRSAFYARIRQYWRGHFENNGRIMVQEWSAGEYMLIDYAGDRIVLCEDAEGKKQTCRVFVAVLPFSRIVYWHATPDMTTQSWIESIQAAFEYFGGYPRFIILDNDTALVNNSERGNQQYSRAFVDLSTFYGIGLSPARVAHPQDKGLVEEAVEDVTNRFIKKILAGSLKSVSDVSFLLAKELEEFNNSVMAAHQITRRKWFALEQPKLHELPKNRFFYGYAVQKRKVKSNGCVLFDTHEYMVPPEYFRQSVGVYVKNGVELNILDLETKREICQYKYYLSGKPDEVEGFVHIKPEYRLSNELTPAGRLEKACDEFARLSAGASKFLEKFLFINSHSEKGHLASRLRYMIKQLQDVDKSTLEDAFEHAAAVGTYDKEALLDYVTAFAKGGAHEKKKKLRTNKSDIPSNGECLRSFDDLFGSKTIQ